MKRFIYLFLAVLILGSCGTPDVVNNDTDPNNPSIENAAPAIDTEIKDSLPDGLDFQGETINLYIREPDFDEEFYTESENGDIVNDAIYRRNAAVEERLNVKLNVIPGPGWQNYDMAMNNMRRSVASDEQAYDIISGWSARVPILAAEGLFLNLYGLKYLNFSEPWWNKSITDELTIAGKLNFASGDINTSLLGTCLIIFENFKIREDLNLPNIYDTVFDNKWTFDYMNNLVKDIYQDLNGDGIRDIEDFYGAGWHQGNYLVAFLSSSNVHMTKKDADNIPYLDIEHEKIAALVNKVYDFIYNNEGVFDTGQEIMEMFVNNRCYISAGYLYFPNVYYRNMESDYGIIPYPKYDEHQEKYMTGIQNGLHLMCVPKNCAKTDAVGAFMEAMASESYKSVTPVYFETAMKIKYARDEIVPKMLDIIRDGVDLNFAKIYSYSLGDVWDGPMRQVVGSKSNNYASWFETNRLKIETALDNLIELMLEAG
ncbi:MAG: extracellular solute-binding protein [Oscillospiraceae bacterium]|nr:extracellular solute-binding protein [Oscillospiraceae bacterium]